MNRVAITGMGMVTALGRDLPTVWRRLLAGDCGIAPIRSFDASEYPCKVAAEVAPVAGQHQCDRVGFLDRRDGLPQREALAAGRSDRTLGGIGTAGGREAVP